MARRQHEIASLTTTSEPGLDALAPPARRAPFSDNPELGERGLRTQQRILDAALEVFDDRGYERSTLEGIAKVAGCSRVAIYQYFSGKEDVFRHLSGTVAQLMRASMEALDPITADGAGVDSLRTWVDRYTAIHVRYEPIFGAFAAAATTDSTLMGAAVAFSEHNAAIFLDRVDRSAVPTDLLEPVVRLLLAGVNSALEMASVLQGAVPDVYTRERVNTAVATAIHRSLFGVRPGVNRCPAEGPRSPLLHLGPVFRQTFDRADELQREASQPGRRALASLLAAGDDVVVAHGYLGTRVDHVIVAASVSRGAFYRYFANIDEFVRVIAVRAGSDVSTAIGDLPDDRDRESLRRWLEQYHEVQSAKGLLVSVWAETIERALRGERAAVFDWGRRRMRALLSGDDLRSDPGAALHPELPSDLAPAARDGAIDRSIDLDRTRELDLDGDLDVDAVVLLAVVSAFASSARGPLDVEAALLVVERGFLDRLDAVAQLGEEF